ncbi:MAG: VOC family protein [Nocardioidaceae bacterium]
MQLPGHNGVWPRSETFVVDCRHPASLARFWSAALEAYQVAPYDEKELRRLKGLGIDGPEDDPTVLVEPSSGSGPRFCFQLVPEPKTAKNRVHLDLQCDNPGAEIARLTELGAEFLAEHEKLIVLADPEGNEFCLLR